VQGVCILAPKPTFSTRPRLGDEFVRPASERRVTRARAFLPELCARAYTVTQREPDCRPTRRDVTGRTAMGKGAVPSYGISGRINRPSRSSPSPSNSSLSPPSPRASLVLSSCLSPPLFPLRSLSLSLSRSPVSAVSLSLSPLHPDTTMYAPCRDPYNSVSIPVFSAPGHRIDIAHAPRSRAAFDRPERLRVAECFTLRAGSRASEPASSMSGGLGASNCPAGRSTIPE